MRILICNLPSTITSAELCTYFEQYGTVYNVYIPMNMKRSSPTFGLNKGHAFIIIEDVAYLYYIASIARPLYICGITVILQIDVHTPPSHKSDPVLLQEVRRVRIQKHMKGLKLLE